jgi:hypothetical protein
MLRDHPFPDGIDMSLHLGISALIWALIFRFSLLSPSLPYSMGELRTCSCSGIEYKSDGCNQTCTHMDLFEAVDERQTRPVEHDLLSCIVPKRLEAFHDRGKQGKEGRGFQYKSFFKSIMVPLSLPLLGGGGGGGGSSSMYLPIVRYIGSLENMSERTADIKAGYRKTGGQAGRQAGRKEGRKESMVI